MYTYLFTMPCCQFFSSFHFHFPVRIFVLRANGKMKNKYKIISSKSVQINPLKSKNEFSPSYVNICVCGTSYMRYRDYWWQMGKKYVQTWWMCHICSEYVRHLDKSNFFVRIMLLFMQYCACK